MNHETPGTPAADPSAVSESTRDLVGLVHAYGAGDEAAFNAVLDGFDIEELRALVAVSCGLLRQCELRYGFSLSVRDDSGT